MKHTRYGLLTKILVTLLAALVLVVGLLSLYAWQMGYFAPGEGDPPTEAQPGAVVMREDLLPDISAYYRVWSLDFRDKEGNTVNTSAYLGRPLVLLYWASWCPDCQSIMADADAFAASVRDAGAELVLVARTGVRDETAETALGYLADNGISEPTLLDTDGAMYTQLGLGWVPTALFFNSGGALVYAQQADLTADSLVWALAYAEQGGRVQTEAFVLHNLRLESGAFAAQFTSAAGQIAPQNLVLSETVGLMLLYACSTQNQALFNQINTYLMGITPDGHIPWQVKDGEPASANATLDDIRIIEALLWGDALWGGYRQQAELYADALYDSCASGGRLRDFSADGAAADTLTLCYANLTALARMDKAFGGWGEVKESAERILLGGRLGDNFPLYAVRYSYSAGGYGEDDFIQMNEALVTVYHLAQAGLLEMETRRFLQQLLETGPVWAAYDITGAMVPGYGFESTASYALLVLIACQLEDAEMARYALWRMENTRVVGNGQSPETGGYLEPNALNYSFDTVMALLAWDALENSGLLPV